MRQKTRDLGEDEAAKILLEEPRGKAIASITANPHPTSPTITGMIDAGILVDGVVERRVAGVVSSSNIGIMVDQQSHHVYVVLQRRHVKCRLTRVTHVNLPTTTSYALGLTLNKNPRLILFSVTF